jgi:hypothetical protein
VGGQRQRS